MKRQNSRSRSREKNRVSEDQDSDPFGMNRERNRRRQLRKQILEAYKKQSSQSSDQQRQPVRVQPTIVFHLPDNKIKQPQPNIQDFDMFADAQYTKQYDNPTDEQGYYRTVSGELLNNKYKVVELCGKGVYGNVVKVVDDTNKEYAVKIIRNYDILMQFGLKEFKLLTKIKSDQIIKAYESFYHRKHLCMVFQLLGMDLRAASKLRNSRSFDLETIKSYAIEMFLGLYALRKAKIIHADIKPDNFLLTRDEKNIKFCDFGTAFPIQQAAIVEELVARYYRAPEIFLGCNIDYSIDTWSVGCTLFELFTGEFLFPGKNNNEMIKLFMETKGKFSIKMLKKGLYTQKYFDKNYCFLEEQVDLKSLTSFTKPVNITPVASRDLLLLLRQKCPPGTQQKKLNFFKDFLDKCLALDPRHRLTPDKAFEHPFLNYQITLQ